ncbi:hypothetical protein ACS0TY_007485 [Phlomoides rotata]
MEDFMGKMNLSQEEDELFINDGSVGIENADLNICLVGRLLTNQSIILTLLEVVWRVSRGQKKGVMIRDIDQGWMLIQFFHELDLQRILDGGPWSFGNHPLIIHRLVVGGNPNLVSFNKLCFWVQVHNLPHGAFTEGVGRLLGNFICQFVEYASSNKWVIWMNYMRSVRVEIDIDLPLKKRIRIRLDNDSHSIVNFKYERRQIFCFIYGRLCHSENFCDMKYKANGADISRDWGVELRALDQRNSKRVDDR